MVDNLALIIARKIKNVVPDHPASLNVLKYALIVILNAIFGIILTLVVSAFTGKTSEVIVIMISFALLRQLSGGYHLKSSDGCVLASAALFTTLSLITLSATWVFALNCISLLLALVYAPAKIDKQSKIPKKYYPFLKLVSLLLITTNLFLQSSTISLALFAQCLTLIRVQK